MWHLRSAVLRTLSPLPSLLGRAAPSAPLSVPAAHGVRDATLAPGGSPSGLPLIAPHILLPLPALAGAAMRRAAGALAPSPSGVAALLVPPLTAAASLPLLRDLMPTIVLTGKGKYKGKNKRHPKPANHNARPCSHIARRQRAAAEGRFKYKPKP